MTTFNRIKGIGTDGRAVFDASSDKCQNVPLGLDAHSQYCSGGLPFEDINRRLFNICIAVDFSESKLLRTQILTLFSVPGAEFIGNLVAAWPRTGYPAGTLPRVAPSLLQRVLTILCPTATRLASQ